MFILQGKKIINLKKVSSIIFDSKKLLINYNFSNSINILGKETSDFYNEEFMNETDFYKIKKYLLNLDFIKENFLISDKQNEIVNKNHINTISLDEEHNKIIFNLDYSIEVVDYKTNDLIKISKFVYWRYSSKKDLLEEYNKIISEIQGD